MTSWASFSPKPELAPNALSALRGILGLVLPFLLLQPHSSSHLLALGLFIFAALTDYWDGLIARRQGLESDLGKIVDPTMDKVLILAPMATFALLDLYSIWWVVPIFFRELAVTFCRLAWLREGRAVAAERLGKIKLVFQVAVVGLAFGTLLSFDYAFLYPARSLLQFSLTVFLILTLGLTLLSGFSFFRSNWKHLHSKAFAEFTSAMGVGYNGHLPGTWGTLLGLFLAVLTHFNFWLYGFTLLFLFLVGYWAVRRLDLSQHQDPRFIVIDEACGIFIPFLGVPLSPLALITGFILFRFFDIAKPYPLRKLEQLPGYWGIVMDDLGAGFYAWIPLFLFFR